MPQLVMDAQGNLYGTTKDGGAYNNGTVFMLNTSHRVGACSTASPLRAGARTAQSPDAGSLLDAQGNLYGTTDIGGERQLPGLAERCSSWTRRAARRVLYSFTGGRTATVPAA